ncbi:hypothetical protein [Staphylococcus pettenkoferi]|uniref:Uncharacterized protein n=1 Tax=Staphylococcus pettenkoferi TaxID=170573 RepID=A0A9Q4D5J9_9STAP|nr:hypothetical protein [Staphylococcus pettenkoferi]MCY1569076.1 hypothetical protein [Staphylococcus pettenkoferi]MCY1575111.1 hypothetical protein [Staphylococcus pettenkoferi]MCY1593730.1 hypothetical protein [Staphylococcus pettenkoferi]MCY1618625.1 hypothetical protein [Staphylococcus pettenkoferi]
MSNVLSENMDGRKTMQKHLISSTTATEITDERDELKSKMKKDLNQLIDALQDHCKNYANSFNEVAKGDWVDEAQKEIRQISKRLDSV